jgi:phospholipase C
MSQYSLNRNRLMLTTALGGALIAAMAGIPAAADDDNDHRGVRTDTPIKHVIVLIGENRSFDSVYGMYRPHSGQSVSNLLSKGIVNSTGMTVLNTPAQQDFIQTPYSTKYLIDYHATIGRTPYANLPQPNTAYAPQAPGGLSQGQGPFNSTVPDSLLPTIEPSFEYEDLGLLRTGATGLPQFSEDTRVTNASSLPNGAFQLTNSGLPYDSYTGDMVHRLFHMWQQSDCSRANATADKPSGCLNDLYPFVGVARNDGSGGNSMGFYNVSTGDAPVLKRLADEYTLNDNYHQPVMGGTAVQHMMIGTADEIPWDTFQGQAAPPAGSVANPDPISTTNVAFKADKAWTNCSDLSLPGIPAIASYLSTLPWHPVPNCASGQFYMPTISVPVSYRTAMWTRPIF